METYQTILNSSIKSPFGSRLILHANETIKKIVSSAALVSPLSFNGTFILTDRRLIIYNESAGKKLTLNLKQVDGIEVVRNLIVRENRPSLNGLKLSVDEKKYVILLAAPLQLIKDILEAILVLHREVSAQSSKNNSMAKHELSLTLLRCPSCGASVAFTNQRVPTKCEYCGSAILASL